MVSCPRLVKPRGGKRTWGALQPGRPAGRPASSLKGQYPLFLERFHSRPFCQGAGASSERGGLAFLAVVRAVVGFLFFFFVLLLLRPALVGGAATVLTAASSASVP